MNRWVEAGAPREKLVLGIAASGRTFTLQDNSTNGVGAPAIGPGIQGEFTLVPGVLSYYEVYNSYKKPNVPLCCISPSNFTL